MRSATDPRIRRARRVPAADRNGLLNMAEAMVFPSKYEGFGAPLIEAMALGVPGHRFSDSTCIPAIVDGAGLVLPLVSEAWADALDRVQRNRADDGRRGTGSGPRHSLPEHPVRPSPRCTTRPWGRREVTASDSA